MTATEIDTTTQASDDTVTQAVRDARTASEWWAELTFEQRARRLDRWRGIIARRASELADVVHRDMGKPHPDAMLEIAMALEHLAWASKNARKVLGRRSVRSSLLTVNQAASVEYRPLGVIGVIGPWNYPVFTPLGSLSFSLAAGNAVVYKPSEFAPAVGQWLGRAFAEVVPEHPVLQVVTGDGSVGAALCLAGVDKIGFTGSTATGKKVMAACAETLTPVLMECGGKDALILDADGNVGAAADAAVWGALSNSGQTCLGVERVYVHEHVYGEFIDKTITLAARVHAGPGAEDKIGPITMPSQVAVIRRHIDDAMSRGGRVVLGGLGSISGQYVQPTIMVDVPEDSLAVTEETFGPTMTITKVASMDEAVELVNASPYALGASVFGKDGAAVADRLRSGGASVNSYVMYAAVPNLPLGGVGASGFGRVHGPDGLKEFTYARSTTRQRFRSPLPLTTFRRTARIDWLVKVLIRAIHGRH